MPAADFVEIEFQAVNEGLTDLDAPPLEECLECGCTETRRCSEGCFWAEPGLCARCADAQTRRAVVAATRRKVLPRRMA